jgi:hypothetical protein
MTPCQKCGSADAHCEGCGLCNECCMRRSYGLDPLWPRRTENWCLCIPEDDRRDPREMPSLHGHPVWAPYDLPRLWVRKEEREGEP